MACWSSEAATLLAVSLLATVFYESLKGSNVFRNEALGADLPVTPEDAIEMHCCF